MLDVMKVGHSWLFREPEQIQPIAELFGGDGGRIWVAGCSSGEDAWSVAALTASAPRPPSILATDLNARAIVRAHEARYGAWAIRAVPRSMRRWFEESEGDLRPVQALRNRVKFERHNLLEPPPGHGFDVILCRNVLIYFDGEARA